jgi:hypothetical protein
VKSDRTLYRTGGSWYGIPIYIMSAGNVLYQAGNVTNKWRLGQFLLENDFYLSMFCISTLVQQYTCERFKK